VIKSINIFKFWLWRLAGILSKEKKIRDIRSPHAKAPNRI